MNPSSLDNFAKQAAMSGSRRQVLRAGLAALAGAFVLKERPTRTLAGEACAEPFIFCNGECVYSLTSNEHCGVCDNACGESVCDDGICTVCETIGQTTCFDEISGALYCADLSSNFNNCGACGNQCTTGPCIDGVCESTEVCEPGLTECLGACVNLERDLYHCGACGNACLGVPGQGQSSIGECVEGVCHIVCLEGYTLCDGVASISHPTMRTAGPAATSAKAN